MHDRGIIHKDIKPANVLVKNTSGGVWLTGFGIASQLSRERRMPDRPELIRRYVSLYGARTDWTTESLDRFAKRSLRTRRHAG
jgi:serine/threonine protein kinase